MRKNCKCVFWKYQNLCFPKKLSVSLRTHSLFFIWQRHYITPFCGLGLSHSFHVTYAARTGLTLSVRDICHEAARNTTHTVRAGPSCSKGGREAVEMFYMIICNQHQIRVVQSNKLPIQLLNICVLEISIKQRNPSKMKQTKDISPWIRLWDQT